jgi:hypothetical protein
VKSIFAVVANRVMTELNYLIFREYTDYLVQTISQRIAISLLVLGDHSQNLLTADADLFVPDDLGHVGHDLGVKGLAPARSTKISTTFQVKSETLPVWSTHPSLDPCRFWHAG